MKKTLLILIISLISITVFSQNNIFDVARKGTVNQMKELLKKDAKLIDSKNEHGFTALILASYRNNINVVSYLLKQGAQVNTLSEMGTALMAATFKGNRDVVEMLLKNGANPNITDPKGTTALHYACLSQNVEIVKLIKSRNPNLDLKDDKNKTALDYAIDLQNIEIIKLLKL